MKCIWSSTKTDNCVYSLWLLNELLIHNRSVSPNFLNHPKHIPHIDLPLEIEEDEKQITILMHTMDNNCDEYQQTFINFSSKFNEQRHPQNMLGRL